MNNQNNIDQPMVNNINQPSVNNNMNQPMYNNSNQSFNNFNPSMNNNVNQPVNNFNQQMYNNMNQAPKNNKFLIIIIMIISFSVILSVLLFDNKDKEETNNETNEQINNEEKNDDDYDYDDYDDDDDIYDDNDEELVKNIETSIVKAESGEILMFIKNKNDKNVEIEVDIEFLDANGKVVDEDYAFTNGIGVNSEFVESLFVENDYSSYNIEVTAIEASDDSFYNSISLTHKEQTNSVVATVKNNANELVEDIEIAIVYYNGEKVVGFDYDFIWDLESKDTEDVVFSQPYDINSYQKLNYTSYKIYLNDAYNW